MILIVGGAGYIGSQIVRDLQQKKIKTIVIDNLELGHREALKNTSLIRADFADKKILRDVFHAFSIDAVIHLAAYSNITESIKNPKKYFKNNVKNSEILLKEMIKARIKKMIFSSSASIYAEQENLICENSPIKPINPYGQSKLEFENILKYYEKTEKINFISLRYFNIAGADQKNDIGEDHRPETHLIPRILKTALGQFEYIEIYGENYPNPDGTCIRDYTHVKDLSQSHILSLRALSMNKKSNFYNVGSGNGYSVKQIIKKAEEITGRTIPYIIRNRKIGDPSKLVTNNRKIKKELGWKPKYSDLDTIIKSAWRWHKNYPLGYK